ncbi:MAG: polynucleotide kinase-phosphatase, partial [Acidobacteria bacterium]|nr:polynucleotide kinase-phosphatase [Acidobacteriota bacterium]
DAALERALLERISGAFEESGLWTELETEWAILDTELMPGSQKAQQLLRSQYAAVGSAANASLPEAVSALERSVSKGGELEAVLARTLRRAELARLFVRSYRQYCWSVDGLTGLKVAPFHLLATEGAAHTAKPHLWHLDVARRLAEAEAGRGLLMATPHRIVNVTDPASEAEGISLWEELTGRGGEGMVVKPLDFIARGIRGLVQPALKVRGPEYLRIIYGPEYTEPDNLVRLRKRGLSGKRSLALREFALGVEGLERFVRREPLRRVHECAFAVLALESEPVDPRL